jgi:acyl transferase domain-containing protein
VYHQPQGQGRSVALGTVKATVGHTGHASGAAALIKTALCLHHRSLPVLPRWTAPLDVALWADSAFYLCAESRAWVKTTTAPGACFHLLLSDADHQAYNVHSLSPHAPKLLSLRAPDAASLLVLLDSV